MRNFHDKTLVRRFRAQTDEGYMVVECDVSGFQNAHPGGYFSITADVYTSERAYKAGNKDAIHASGCMHEEIVKAFPELARWLPMHGGDAITGADFHAEANAWYYFQTAAGLASGWTPSTYEKLPEGTTIEQAAYERLCRHLNVESVPMVAIGHRAEELRAEYLAEPREAFYRAALKEYIDNELRSTWQEQADAFRAFLAEGQEDAIDEPDVAEREDVETFSITLEGTDGPLKVTAKLDGEEYDDIGGHNVYKVTVKGTAKPKTYTARFWASTHDYDRGHIDAREAAYGILRELVDIYWDEDGELLDMMKEQRDEEKRAASLRSYKRATTFAEAYWRTLEDNSDLIGR